MISAGVTQYNQRGSQRATGSQQFVRTFPEVALCGMSAGFQMGDGGAVVVRLVGEPALAYAGSWATSSNLFPLAPTGLRVRPTRRSGTRTDHVKHP